MLGRINLEAWHGRSLFVLFAWSALALGSARPFAVATSAALALVAYTVGRIERGWLRHGARMDGVGIVLLVLTAFTFLQLVPLPPAVVELLSPRAFALHDAAWTPLGVTHREEWFSLSVDAPATALAAIAMLTVTFTYLTVRYRLRAHGGRSVLNPLVAAGATVALVFFLHRLAGWTKVYDEYVPRYVATDLLPAPFLNANHLAAALGFAATLAFGLALTSIDRFRRLTLVVAGAATGGACLLTLSRGGILAFIAGQALFLLLRFASRRSETARSNEEKDAAKPSEEPAPDERSANETRGRRRSSSEARASHLAWASLGGLLAITAGSYVAYDAILSEFEHGDSSKWEIARDAMSMTADYPLTGIGRGAFLAAYPPYQTQVDTATYTHPENVIPQYLVEWGLPLGGLALLGLVFVLGRAVLRPPIKAHNAAAVAAAFAVLLQNTVDFSLELLGLALPFIAVLAVVREAGAVGDRERVRKPSHPRLRIPGPAWLAAIGGSIVVLSLLYPWASANELEAESDRFRLYAADRKYHPGLLDDARGAFARHPADYYLPFLVGVHLYRAQHGSPITFWNEALRLRPCSSVTHFAVATYLARDPAHRAQAAGEYGLAVHCRPAILGQSAAAVAAITRTFADADEFVSLASADPVPIWDALGAAYEARGNAEAAAAADAALLQRDPKFPAAHFRRARAALNAELPDEAMAELRRCGKEAALLAPYYLLGARALQQQGKAQEAMALLERGLDMSHSPEIPVALSDLHAAAGDFAGAEQALATLESRARTQQERSDAVVRRVLLLVRSEQVAEALAQARRALGIDPSRLDLWRLAADLAERLGDTPGLVWALRELARRQPKDATIRERLRQAETRATEIRLLRP